MIEAEDCENALILIIDDDAGHRLIARKSLEQAGFMVEEAEDGKQGLLAVKKTRPDLVLLDVMMPKFDGYDVCVELRRDPESMNLPVLMVTALDDIESINRAFEAGGTNFVTKPVNWTVLAFHVKYILRASQNAEELNKTKQLLTLARESAEVVHKKQRMISSTDLESFTSDNP
jgi:DNA-binding response OmpR family regulator